MSCYLNPLVKVIILCESYNFLSKPCYRITIHFLILVSISRCANDLYNNQYNIIMLFNIF